jgi:hypothetical protein
MFCSKCGIALNVGSIFCHTCGAKILQATEEPLPVLPAPVPEFQEIVREIVMEEVVQELPPPVPQMAFVPEKGTYEQAGQPQPNEKGFFGLPAFIFCLVIIGLLSVSTGVFAMLYFGG